MSFREESTDFRDENLLTDKTETKIVTFVTSLNTFLENVFRTNTKTSHYHTTIMIKSLRQQKLNLQTIINVYREQHVTMTAVTFI